MKVLLQNAQTRKYWTGNEGWTGTASEAFDFRQLNVAAQKAFERESEDLNVVLRYDEPQCELAINPVFCV